MGVAGSFHGWTVADYCTRTDIENRLTANGILYVADRDGGGTASETELGKYIDPSLSYATNLIDGFLDGTYVFQAGIGNGWLKDRAIDIAAAKCVEVGGQTLPDAMKEARDFSLSLLMKVMTGAMRVPGLSIPAPINAPWPRRTPVVINPKVRW